MRLIYSFFFGVAAGAIISLILKASPTETTFITETVYDTIIRTIEKPITVVKEKIVLENIEVSIPEYVDSAAIISQYLQTLTFKRVWEDKDIRIALTDTLTQNRLLNCSLSYSILRPTSIQTTTVKENTRYLFLEGLLPVSNPLNPGLKISYVGNKIYSVTARPASKTIELGFGWKIKEW